MFKFKFKKLNNEGAILPLIIVLLSVISSVGLGLILQSGQSFNTAVYFSYNQLAHVTSKAAIDYAEEQYELNASYTGTAEQNLVVTSKYRTTIQVEVIRTEGPSSKRVRAYGRVYIPEQSATADFTREIQSSIIRNGSVAGSPSDYEPVLWLSANEPNSLFASTGAGATLLDINSSYTSPNRSTVTERGSDAVNNVGKIDTSGDDLQMSWGGNNKGHQLTGLRFTNVNIPKNQAIEKAYIQFTANKTATPGSVQLKVQGVASDNAPTWNGNGAVSGASKTSSSVIWDPPNWNSVGANGENERIEVTSIVQEIVNRTGWSANNAMALVVSWVQGSGVRTAKSGKKGGHPKLVVQYGSEDAGGGLAEDDGDKVGEWLDKSGKSNHAKITYGDDAILKTNQINGKKAVRISKASVFLSNLNPAISNNGVTSFIVMKPSSSDTDSGGRFMSLMNSSQANDYNTNNGVVLMQRQLISSSLAQYYNGKTGETLPNALDESWNVYSSRITGSFVERLLKNGNDNYSEQITNMNYNVNQAYLGGRRSSSSPADLSSMDVAEVILYDRALVCSETHEVENYLGLIYDIAISTKSC
jgi:hypothetical protein